MKPSLPLLMTMNGGYVDAAGFLALHGLFTTHVTGNFVTLGAALVLGTSGAVTKLVALPIFCLTVVATRLGGVILAGSRWPALRTLLAVQLTLLIVSAVLAIDLGPFENGDGWPAIFTGMVLVAAMAIQNATHRIYLAASPPSTVMTGSTTQIMLDLADLLRGVPAEARSAIHVRLAGMISAVLVFAIGCATAALLYATQGIWCFALPPLLSACTLWMKESGPPKIS